MKKIALLGSTGSIGTQTLEVIDELQGFKVQILSAHKNTDLIIQQVHKYNPEFVILTHWDSFKLVEERLKDLSLKVLYGIEGILQSLEATDLDLLITAVSGASGIRPTLKAIELGIDVALANKETIVAAGELVERAQKKSGAKIIPVDSEHSAIMQCLEPQRQALGKIILTASGGPFRNYSKEELAKVTPKEALKHPNWNMGKKITIDSATMMNKGLEVIEAHWLFSVPYEDIEVVIHPQSIVHSMVKYGDGSILAHLGLPDMRVPIQYALTYPNRTTNSFPKLDLTKVGKLEFFPPDMERFPCLKLAYEVGKKGQTFPTVLNAANEVAVELFLQGNLTFLEIPLLIEKVLEKHNPIDDYCLDDLLEIDKWARIEAERQYLLLG
ncbi:MAG: 1-deoxy-D-xylulose-5-phosphate reductoisomerase [Clostridia bacterium]|nr:1-deoxy-D-xylulose-5-phosphate reductoisomerase [Clostridia bacterium]